MFTNKNLDQNSFFIAEIGQNHNGSLEKALEYIDVFGKSGATAIKFQTRDNKYLFDKKTYMMEYNSENAFAKTYGEHREVLELQKDWYPILKAKCNDMGVMFMSTPFDEPSLEFLMNIDVDILKVASFDLGNLPFLNKISKTGKPTVISTGGGHNDHIERSIKCLTENNLDIAVLHCVSEYPCSPERLGLLEIKNLIKLYPNITIGSSDHFSGTLSGPLAYMLGARVFEKHVTLNRSQIGTDHSFALEPKGFQDFVRDIKRAPLMLPPKNNDELGKEGVFQKLGKSVVAYCDIALGEEFTFDNLSGKILTEQIIPVRDSNQLVGKKSLNNISAGSAITFEDIV